MNKMFLGGVSLAFAMLTGIPAHADPADRVAVAAGAAEAFECNAPDPNVPGIPCSDIGGLGTSATTILGPFEYKSNSAADLVFQLTTECTLFNYVKSSTDDGDWATSEAAVVMWIEIDDDPYFGDPVIVKVSPSDTTSDPNGKITMCSRSVGLKLTGSFEDSTDQVTAELAIKSMAAQAFNWVMQNPASEFGTNVYNVRVRAQVALNGASARSVSGAGFRQRTLIVDSIHLANGTEY